jgi:hypothetical protein
MGVNGLDLRYRRRVASNLECVGLGVADKTGLQRLMDGALADATHLGAVDGVTVLRWEDPSGARLVLAVRDRKVLDLLPSFAGEPGARLDRVGAANGAVAIADVVDEDGEQTTMIAVELEQRRFLAVAAGPVAGPASVVALGVDVTVHAGAEAFAASDASLLSTDGGDPGEPPAHVVERGLPWPPRMAAESLISYGVFGPAEQAEAYARLNGTVLRAERRTVAATGARFVVARVRTVGLDLDLCLPTPVVPEPGAVIGGTVFLVASLPFATNPPSGDTVGGWPGV